MKTIQISQLKGKNFDKYKLVDSVFIVDKHDIASNKTRCRELLKDLETLREALFFKQKKLNIQLRTIEEKIEVDNVINLQKELEDLKVTSSEKSKEVLERNKEIYELKLINKVCRHYLKAESGDYSMLSALVDSEDKDDWVFLGFFIQKCKDLASEEIKEKLNEMRKRLEEKLIGVFEQGVKSRNRTIMKSSYTALAELNLEHNCIQTFIYDLEIFKTQHKTRQSKLEIVDVDFFDEEFNDFFELINKIKMTYQEELSDLENIFSDYQTAYKIINNKLFHEIIFPALDNNLKSNNPFVYLYTLQRAYQNILNLGKYIESVSFKFNAKAMADEVVERYGGIALEKEKELFNEIFSYLILGNKPLTKYVILGMNVEGTLHFKDIIKQLLNINNQFIERSKLFYSEDDVNDMLLFYSKKLAVFLENIYESKDDKVEIINEIEYVYLITKRFFGVKFNKLHTFSSKVDELIKFSFKLKLEQCEGRIKQVVDQIFFYKLESDLYFLEYLKTQVEDVRRVKGRNFVVFCNHIFTYSYDRLKKRIFEIRFGDIQKDNIKLFVSQLIALIDLLGIVDIQKLYKTLSNIVLLITVDLGDLYELVSVLKIKMDTSDIKKALKCRKDKNTIRLN